MTFSDTLEEKKHCITVHPELCSGDAGALLPPTCRLFRHRGLLGPLWTATRLFRTHFPKWRWQAESESLQVCVHDGGLSRRQLEQEVCWHESWHPDFCRDTDLRKDGQSKFVLFFFNEMFRWTISAINYLAEHMSEGWAWQNSLVHSGWQVSGSKDPITAQAQMTHRDVAMRQGWILRGGGISNLSVSSGRRCESLILFSVW